MAGTFTTISALLLAVAGLNLGSGLQGTLLGVRAGMEHFSVFATGLVMAAYYGGFILGSTRTTRLVNTVGHIRTFAALASIFSSAALLHAIYITPLSWAILRGVSGFCLGGSVMVAESWLNHASTNTNRGAVLSIYMMVSLGATGVGQLFLNLFPPGGFELFIVVSVLISLALVPVALTTNPAPPIQETTPMRLRTLLAATPLGVAGVLATGMINGAMWSLGAVYAHGIGMSTARISLFMFLFVVGGMAFQWPIGRLSDRMDRRKVITGLLLAAVAAALGFVAMGDTTDGIHRLLLMVLFGAIVLPIYGVVVAHANDTVDREQFVPAASMLLLCYGIGATIGPAVAALAMTWLGPRGLFAFMAAVGVAVGFFALYRAIHKDPIPEEERSDFVPVPRTTPVAIELDPRSEEIEETEPLPDEEMPIEEGTPGETTPGETTDDASGDASDGQPGPKQPNS